MPVHSAMETPPSPSSPQGFRSYQNGGGGGGVYCSSPEERGGGGAPTQLMPRAPERSTSSREAVQRGLGSWHQYSLPDDPFGPPPQTTHSLPLFPPPGPSSSASQRDIERSIEALNMLMLDLAPLHLSKSQSAPCGEEGGAASGVCLARPSYQADSAIHAYSSSGSGGLASPTTHTPGLASPTTHTPGLASPTTHTPGLASPTTHTPGLASPTTHTPGPGGPYAQQDQPCSSSPDHQGASSSPYLGYSTSSSPLPKDCTSSPQPKEQEEEESLNLEGLVAHRIAEYNARIRGINASITPQPDRHRSHSFSGMRSRGMTPETTPATMRRRTTSEGQYQASHLNLASQSQELASAIGLNPGGRPREGPIHSYREAFEGDGDVDSFCGGSEHPTPSFPASPTTPYYNMSRSPLGFAQTPLSVLGLKPQGGAADPGGPGQTHTGHGGPDSLGYRGQSFNPLSSSCSPTHSPESMRLGSPAGCMAEGGYHGDLCDGPTHGNPEGVQVVLGLHTVPGSPNTLHRTVATNTPPSPALQRRLANQSSPASLPRHPHPANGSRAAAAAVPPSPLPSRRGMSSGLTTPEDPTPTPCFPVAPALPGGHGGATPTGNLPDLSKFSIYDGCPDIKMNVKFVQDTSKFWYKPDITREQAIGVLKEREPGAFVIRDSHSFRGAYGLAMKVACPPPTAQHAKRVGDITNELVRHFLIETSPKGVRLKGCPNEPYFGCLSALVYQHSMTPLALPCKLMIPAKDPNEEALELATPTDTALLEMLRQGAAVAQKPPEEAHACNVLYIRSVDMESLTGPQAVAKAITMTLATNPLPMATIVHFKVSTQGITLTDNQRKIFFRRHYPLNSVTYCDLDPQDRRWGQEGGAAVRMFGFVARKQGSWTDNVSHLFAESDPAQPASSIVSFVSKVLRP